MFKSTTNYYVGKTDFLIKVFPTGVLPSGFIDKGRCGIGGTRMEIKNNLRCSIITVPTIGIIKSKVQGDPSLFGVYGDVSYEEVYLKMQNRKLGDKLITTPEGVEKIMRSVRELNIESEIYDTWFFMLDEAQSFISEHFRTDILIPFDYFWKFKNKCILSATPYYFTDPRMIELDFHKVNIQESLGDITLVNAYSIDATLNHLLRQAYEVNGNLHIFYNSVTEIVKAIRKVGLRIEECNVYCADDNNRNNLKTLAEFVDCFQEQPHEANFKKINFYTSRYFEGWDMFDDDATLVMVTNIHSEYTKVGVKDKCIQAFGRLRGKKNTSEYPKPNAMIHITNAKFEGSMKSFAEVENDFLYQAERLIQQNNVNMLDERFKLQMPDTRLEKFSTVDKKTMIATINHMKLDQQINQRTYAEVYNNIQFVREAWQEKFKVDQEYKCDMRIETSTATNRRSKSAVFKEDYESILAYEKNKLEGTAIWNWTNTTDEVRKRNPLAYEAWQLLNPEEVVKLKYNIKGITQEIIYKSNQLAELKLLKLLDQEFKVGRFYTNETTEKLIQKFYNQLGVKNKDGMIKPASPAHLGAKGRFEIKKDKGKDKQGSFVHGYRIVGKQFELLIST